MLVISLKNLLLIPIFVDESSDLFIYLKTPVRPIACQVSQQSMLAFIILDDDYRPRVYVFSVHASFSVEKICRKLLAIV